MREQNWSVCCRACGHSQLAELGRNQNSGDDDTWDLECSIRTQEPLALAADGRQISKKNFHENLNTAVSAVGSAYRVAKALDSIAIVLLDGKMGTFQDSALWCT